MKRIIIGIVLFVLLIGNAVSDDEDSGIIYGKNWAFMFSVPDGYIWDNVSLQQHGIWALFYKADQEIFYGNKHHLYINPIQKGDGYPETTDELINWDISYYKQNDPALKVSFYTEKKITDGHIVKIYSFDQKLRSYYMYYGYLTENNSSFIFVLIARSQKERKEKQQAYFDLIQSFKYLDKE